LTSRPSNLAGHVNLEQGTARSLQDGPVSSKQDQLCGLRAYRGRAACSACLLSVIIAFASLPAGLEPAFGSPSTMKGPSCSSQQSPSDTEQDTSPVKQVFLGAIYLYRSVISPTQGSRCGFYPSCSTFGMHAVHDYGAVRGIMMTADRLTRCNLLKSPGPDYFLRPDGRLYDPVIANLLKEH